MSAKYRCPKCGTEYHERPPFDRCDNCPSKVVPLLAAVCLALSGCASYDWHKVRPAAGTVRVVDAPVSVIQAMPRCEGARHCAVTFPKERVCVVLAQMAFMSKSDAAHEMKHCEGWDHQ